MIYTSSETLCAVIDKLNEARDILTKDMPDMDISEWNATPIGRAVRRITDAIDMMVDNG